METANSVKTRSFIGNFWDFFLKRDQLLETVAFQSPKRDQLLETHCMTK